MELKIKTLRAELKPLKVEGEWDLSRLKEEVAKTLEIHEDFFKIVHKGQILKSGVLKDMFLSGDFFVVCPVIPKHPIKTRKPPAPKATNPLPNKPVVQEKPPSNSLLSLLGLVSSPPSRSSTKPVDIPVPKQPKIPEIKESQLSMLTGMGFSENGAKRALYLHKMNIQAAMEWLIEHCEDKDLNDPVSQEWVEGLYGIIKASNTGPPVEFVPNPVAMQRLSDMGFPEEDIKQALKQTKNNYELAAAWLLGDRDQEDDQEEDEDDDEEDHEDILAQMIKSHKESKNDKENNTNEEENVLSLLENHPLFKSILTHPTVQESLKNPRVLEALKQILDDPSTIQNYENDNEIAPIIQLVFTLLLGKQQ